MKKPSVLFINRVSTPSDGENGRLLYDLAHFISNKDRVVTIITTSSQAPKSNKENISLRHIRASENSNGFFSNMWLCLKFLWVGIFTQRHDFIVTMTSPAMLIVVGNILAKIKKSKHVHWCQELYPDILSISDIKTPNLFKNFLEKGIRNALKSCDYIVVIGNSMAKKIKQSNKGIKNIKVIENWANYEIFYKKDAKGHSLHDDPEWVSSYPLVKDSKPRFRLLYTGEINQCYPVDTILDAADKLQEYNDIEFIFMGEGSDYERLAEQRSQRILDNVKLLPSQPEVKLRTMLENGDVHLVSMNENASGLLMPNNLYLAIASCRPCLFIGPHNTDTKKIIEDFHAGKIIAQGNSEKLAEAILNYRMNSDEWFYAQEGAAQASASFYAEKSFSQWDKLIN